MQTKCNRGRLRNPVAGRRAINRWSALAICTLTICALAFSGAAFGQVPVGSEIAVNTFTLGGQGVPSVASNEAGEFVVVWQSYSFDPASGFSFGIRGQRLAANGSLLGDELQISTTTEGQPSRPRVAALPGGGFTVIWQSDHQDGSDYGVYGRSFADDGVPQTGEFRVNSYTTGRQRSPDVAVTSTGELVVVWHGEGPDNTTYGIHGRRLAADSSGIGDEFAIGDGTSRGLWPAVAVDPDDGFFVTWTRSSGPTGEDIHGRRFAPTGEPLGAELVINTTMADNQRRADVATDSAGDFVVVWNSTGGQDGSGYGVFGRRMSSAARQPTGGGPFLTDEFQVNTFTPGDQTYPQVATGPHGAFLVSWGDHGTSGPGHTSRIAARWFAADGTAFSDDFTVNPIVAGHHFKPSAAIRTDDDFLIAWTTAEVDATGNTSEVRAQHFVAPCIESALTLCLGDGRFRVRVSWRDFADAVGDGHALPRTGDSGVFWFFDPANIELVVKVLDGRALNNHFWVFFGSLSNVEFTLTVTDTETGNSRVYVNPLGTFSSTGDVTALPATP